ncbi:hypothetical protein B0H13DRAFT_2455910 [Mycena leptocephala]|nr:hypothetical protein B0H13DRAFT_2455910 [Mycena leptocephala]
MSCGRRLMVSYASCASCHPLTSAKFLPANIPANTRVYHEFPPHASYSALAQIFGDPSPEAWARFDYYARKVRKVDYIPDRELELDPKICARILQIKDYVAFDVSLTHTNAPQANEITFGWLVHRGKSTKDYNLTVTTAGFARSLPQIHSLDLTGSKSGYDLDDLLMLASLTSPTSLAVWISVLEICGQKWPTLRTLFFDVTDVNLTGAGCAPLANLTSLEHLRFGSYRRVAAVKPLQNLVSLCALSWRGLTIEALHHVSLHLPRLKSLELTFEPPLRPPPIGSEEGNHALQTLLVNASEDDGPVVHNVEAAVCYLHHLFPYLRIILVPNSMRRVEPEIEERWLEVREFLNSGCPSCSDFSA